MNLSHFLLWQSCHRLYHCRVSSAVCIISYCSCGLHNSNHTSHKIVRRYKSFLETVEATTSPIDTTPPVVSVPEDIIAEATGPEGRIVNYMANATDTVDGNLATVCNPKSGSMFALGQTRVECTANDGW